MLDEGDTAKKNNYRFQAYGLSVSDIANFEPAILMFTALQVSNLDLVFLAPCSPDKPVLSCCVYVDFSYSYVNFWYMVLIGPVEILIAREACIF